ncbi:hypothetical protein IQ07DRAFT_526326 [Pyrenochaeta sp. DS3sAY3a]|nr:hypothetical protein IQ07DRAFT_526326 [Pyrenochaeta sp. DS3sAY3a]
MSSILATTLFATFAAAQITTSIWLPGAAEANQTFVGSVIAQSGDQTTLSLAFADGPAESSEYYRSAPPTVTLEGTTFVAYQATAEDPLNDSDNTVTVSLECSRSDTNAAPTCVVSTAGVEAVISELYSQYYLNNFQLIITAGEEKLSAVAAATPTASGASVTGSGSAVSGSGSAASGVPQQSTNAAGPMMTMAPALAGLGAAAAAYFL